MAAVIDLRTARRFHGTAVRQLDGTAVRHLEPVGPDARPAERRPPLRVVEGGRAPQAVALRRTYLRRRLLVVTLGVLVLLGGAELVGAVVGPASGAPVPAERVHLVQQGDTLWSVAGRMLPGGDRRDAVARIAEANPGLVANGGGIRAGDVLRIPAR